MLIPLKLSKYGFSKYGSHLDFDFVSNSDFKKINQLINQNVQFVKVKNCELK